MKKQTILIGTLLGVVILLSGCNKNPFSGKGGEITFGTTTENVATRTEYGANNDAGAKQAIDWVVGDVIRIISPEAAVTGDGSNLHWADYTVKTVNKSADATSAAVVNTNPNGLAWTDASTYSFYSVYPSTTPISMEEGTYGQVTANFITATQALPAAGTTPVVVGEGDDAISYTEYTPAVTNAVMTAVATGVKENDNKPQVQLHFKPAWTAIEFNLSSQDNDVEITQIQLVAQGTDYLAGPFTMTAGDAAFSTVAVTTASASQTVTMATTKNNAGVTVTKNQGAVFTMLLLPKANTQALKFRVTSKEGDGTKTSVVTLAKKSGDVFVLEPGKKYRITGFKVPGNYWRIFFAPDILDADQWEELGETTLIVE